MTATWPRLLWVVKILMRYGEKISRSLLLAMLSNGCVGSEAGGLIWLWLISDLFIGLL